MASVSKDKDGGRRILFINSMKKRKTIRLGKMPIKAVNELKLKIEALNWAVISKTTPDVETAGFVTDLDSLLYDKLAKVGLVPKKAVRENATLGAFIDAYLLTRKDIGPGTRINLLQVRRGLVEYFGESKPLAEITVGDADDWRIWLAQEEVMRGGKVVKRRLGRNTTSRHCSRARQLFRAAVKRRLISSNPFGEMKGLAVQANPDRFYFISLVEAAKIIEACPDSQWKLLVALARFGGLRCPSEPLLLQWGDIDWENNRMVVHSPKTKHHQGKESREVPIFPELRIHLEKLFNEYEAANSRPPSQAEWVITRYRDTNTNLRTQLLRIIAKAGLTPWPKLFQNMRSTRETELAESHAIHKVCAWLGNSQAVAKKHYLQITDEHFRLAATIPTVGPSGKVAQNPAHQPATTCINQPQRDADLSGNSHCVAFPVPPVGLEPTTH